MWLVRFTTGLVIQMVYGRVVQGMNDEYVIAAQKAVEGVAITHVPGMFWVEFFPLLRYVPSWVPGARFQGVAKYYRRFVEKMRDDPFEATKSDMVS